MDIRTLPSAIEPSQWFIVFHETTKSRLVSFFAFGRFKHVSREFPLEIPRSEQVQQSFGELAMV